jgi:hypothetical protein
MNSTSARYFFDVSTPYNRCSEAKKWQKFCAMQPFTVKCVIVEGLRVEDLEFKIEKSNDGCDFGF